MRVSPGSGSNDRVALIVDGQELDAFAGETVAAAMIANGMVAQSQDKDGSPRGHFCGMGVCHDCLVVIDGIPSQRACMTKVTAGMAVTRQKARPAALPLSESTPSRRTETTDILIVGAGPGGLSAALAARAAGASVLVVDERPAPGGQFYKQPGYAGAVPDALRDAQSRNGATLIEDARRAGIAISSSTLVWGAFRAAADDIEIAAVTDGVALSIKPRIVIIATGAYERPAIVPGWTLPGVMTPGGAQTLLRSYGVVPGKRLLIAGNGPLNLQLADEFRRVGLRDIIVVEAAPAPWRRPLRALALAGADAALARDGFRTVSSLRAAGVRILWHHALVRVEGNRKAERAFVARRDDKGKPEAGSERVFEVDAVMASAGFLPASELPRQLGCAHRIAEGAAAVLQVERNDDGSTSRPDVFVVGEAGGFGGAHIAMAQGTLAGREAAKRLGFDLPPPLGDATSDVTHHRRFQKSLWALFAAPDPGLGIADDDTIVCRCESVTLGDLKQAIEKHGAQDIATLKRLTRAGMGRCQARYCGVSLHGLVAAKPKGEQDFLTPQPPLRPVPLGLVAEAKPEWRGHKRALLPRFDQRGASPLPETECATLVIGAGVAGLATAYYLSRAGHDVIVLERGWSNGSASGGNAGSLHAQLLSFDFDPSSTALTPAMRTLALQKESIALWQGLQQTLGMDLQVKITGGLMIAASEDDLRRMAAKTAIERAQGIDSEVVDGSTLRSMEPAISTSAVGAAYCPIEGKINPLVATQALGDAARSSGARLYDNCNVVAIAREGGGFVVTTSRGTLRAGRVVNTAGPFARAIGTMLGVDIPVYGAPLQMIVTEAVAPLVSCLVAHASRHLSLKQAANGNIIIGGGWYAGVDPVRGRAAATHEGLEGNIAVAQSVVPQLAHVHMIRSWAAMNIDIDGAPILGEHPAVPGFYTAVGANGYTLAPAFGLSMAELILHGRAERDISAFSVTRFA